MTPRGRPPKPEGEKYVGRLIKVPPKLWAEVDDTVGPGGNVSEFVRVAIEARLKAARKKKPKDEEPTP